MKLVQDKYRIEFEEERDGHHKVSINFGITNNKVMELLFSASRKGNKLTIKQVNG